MSIKKKDYKLYSFDIFDTVITRRVASPKGIFVLMQENLVNNPDCPSAFSSQFYTVRTDTEKYLREYYQKNYGVDDIQYHQIYGSIKDKYNLSESSIEYLKNLEFNYELENVVGIEENINKIQTLLKEGKRVIFISDMYYSEEQLHKLLSKVSPIFENIKIYSSSDCKVSKNSGDLYKFVSKQEGITYKNWLHTGDNKYTDIKQAKKYGIQTVLYDGTKLLPYEQNLISSFPNDISVQLSIGISKILRLNFKEKKQDKYNFGASYSGPILYNYISEVVNTALKQGYKTLYFIARDGYIPKLIADIIIESKNLPIKTKYIYGSRQAWRIPDENNYEYFIEIIFKELQYKLSLGNLSYRCGIPVDVILKYVKIKSKTAIFSNTLREKVKSVFLNNAELKNEILNAFSEKRKLFIEYLKQEIDFEENDIVFVEVNGSGKTQVILDYYLKMISKCNVYTFYLTVSPGIADYNLQTHVFCTRPRKYSTAIELICRTDYGQTIGYKKDNSNIIPIFETFNKKAIINWGYKEHLRGIIDFSQAAANAPENICNKELFYTYFDYITKKCDRETAALLGDVPFLLVGSEDKVTKAAPELTIAQILKHFLFRTDLTEFSQYPELSYARGNKIINCIKSLKNKFEFISNTFIELKLFLLLKSIKNKKIVFWGASIFLENFIKKWHIKSNNILGIIDKNPNRQNQYVGKYQIFSPEKLADLKPNCLILTIKNNHKKIYKELSSFIKENYKNLTLLQNIFENYMK